MLHEEHKGIVRQQSESLPGVIVQRLYEQSSYLYTKEKHKHRPC